MKCIKLCFYGLSIELKSHDQQILDNIKRDYSFFIDEKCAPAINIQAFNKAPDYAGLPDLQATLYTPRNICYKNGHRKYIDYFGKGLAVLDQRNKNYTVYSADEHLLHEIIYLTIMSAAGSYLDSRALHRMHALGIEVNKKGILILLPMGGGKTTLLLELLKKDSIKIISEDTPLINKNGDLLPFPIRIGISAYEAPQGIDKDKLRLVRRMEFGPKYLMDIDEIKKKISQGPISSGIIIVGSRGLSMSSCINRLSKARTMLALIKNGVIGLGLYQGIEFILHHSPVELIGKSRTVFSRMYNAYKALRKSKTYIFDMGHDKTKNADILGKFLNLC